MHLTHLTLDFALVAWLDFLSLNLVSAFAALSY